MVDRIQRMKEVNLDLGKKKKKGILELWQAQSFKEELQSMKNDANKNNIANVVIEEVQDALFLFVYSKD